MVEVEIDGRKVEVLEGSMVMDAAAKLDIYVPHFCYHKKLSIAANCRMCLVEVEKAPKPLPACATPVTQGMIVRTASEKAKQAQKSVMEFLLINHPLDCPICDQGGECQLQDLAVGYGGSESRYDQAKRVVFHKGLGPLISAEEMTRCIHCTRCVRFGQEIAGQMELGMAGRGEHSEILSFVDKTVDNELSGNMIDLCPVGALTSKPFRYAARTWELSRRKSVSGHDALGSNLIVQVKNHRVLRVLPLENEAVNECWLSDRDRFSYEGLYAADRLTRPMIKQGGQWKEVDWADALDYVTHALTHVKGEHGAAAIGALAAPNSTLEELFLLGRLMRGLGSDNIDHRLRQCDFSADAVRQGAPWLGMPIAQINQLDRALLIGAYLRKDHPLLAARLRAATKRGCQVSVLHAVDDDLLMPVLPRRSSRRQRGCRRWPKSPRRWRRSRGSMRRLAACSRASRRGGSRPASPTGSRAPCCSATGCAKSAGSADPGLGAVDRTGDRCHLWRTGRERQQRRRLSGRRAADRRWLNARTMIEQPRRAYLLWNLEPEYDTANAAATLAALAQADTVIACSPYRNGALEYADVILPIAPFFETSGTFVNAEGRAQTFNGAVRPFGDARPGWKVLRVLGTQLGLPGFDFDTPEAVRAALPATGPERLSGRIEAPLDASPSSAGLQRVADVPIYFTDSLVRRAESLQMTADARPPRLTANAATLARAGLAPGDKARARQGEAAALLECAVDARLPDDVVRVPAGHASTSTLGPMYGAITLERA
jgi:NADH-quinone oxidoreductase subunit G